MSIKSNKQVALRILDAIAAHDPDVFDQYLSDDAIFVTCGKPHLFAGAGCKNKAEIVAYMATPSPYEGGGVYTVKTIIAEGEQVMIESHNTGKVSDGRVYENDYIHIFTFNADKVHKVSEYFDISVAKDFLDNLGIPDVSHVSKP